MGKEIEKILKRTETRIGEKYEQGNLKDLEITKPVAGKRVFDKAKGIRAKEVRAKNTAFYKAEFCKAEKVKAPFIFYEAKDSGVEYARGMDAFTKAENCWAGNVEVELEAFAKAKNCRATKVNAGKFAFNKAENCWAGEVKANYIFWGANNCQAERAEGRDAFYSAQKFLLIKEVNAEFIGADSQGVVILGKVEFPEAKIFPSVNLLEGKIKEPPLRIETFFKEELKNSQLGEESIFDHLSYFGWEGETLAEGKEKLKKRYNGAKENIKKLEILEKELGEKFFFFYLLDNNSRREEVFQGLEKLRKVEKNSLLGIDHYWLELQKIKEYLPTISLKDWVRLGNYAEFLAFDDKNLKELENIKKENEPEDKIKNYILNVPKENLKEYTKTLGLGEEINDDIFFAARLHKVLDVRGEEKNKKILEELMKGKKLIEFEENKLWIEKMKHKLDTEKWLAHKQKDYTPVVEKDYSVSLKKAQKFQIKEIARHLKEIGIRLPLEIKIEEIRKIISEKGRELPPNIKEDIRTHLQAYYSSVGMEKSSLPQKIIIKTEENPLKAVQMGERVIGSCLRIRGGHEEGIVPNTADINKRTVWVEDENGNILGWKLIVITEEGKLVGFQDLKNDTRIDLQSCYKDFFTEFARELKIELTSKGTIREIVGEHWYDGGAGAVEF